jgi:hypothetical protein
MSDRYRYVNYENRRKRYLASQGIGHSHDAVIARRVRHTRLTQEVLDEGLRLPGWINIPSLATPDNVSAYLDRLSPEARQKALTLMQNQSKAPQIAPKSLPILAAPANLNLERQFFPDPLGIIGAIGLGDKLGDVLTWLENTFEKK